MVVVTNRLRLKLGMAEKMAPMFTRQGALQEMKGFIKVEVLLTKDLSDYDELNVNMYWESLADFNQWKNSDSFKEAHKGAQNPNQESPILGSQIIISEIASTLGSK